jgi:hypothetical protein
MVMTDHTDHDEMLAERPTGPSDDGACSLEELAERIGAVIAWVGAALRCEAAGAVVELDDEVAEALVRGWISGLEPGARAQFLALVLSDRCFAERARIVRAIREGLMWPDAGPPVALDPSRYSCESVRHAPAHDAPGLAGAGRVQPLSGPGDALRE